MAWAHLGLALGFAIIFALFLLADSGLDYLQVNVLGLVPGQELKIGVKKTDVSLFRLPAKGSPETVTGQAMEELAALPGVRAVRPLTYGTQPTEVEVWVLTKNYRYDMVIQGFDPSWLEDEMPAETLAWQEGQPVPVVINTQLLAIYNSGYAQSRGVPELSPAAVTTPVLKIRYGGKSQPPVELNARIVGMSPRVALGLAIPQQALDDFHRRLNIEPAPVTEAALILDPEADVPMLRRAVADAGYELAEPHPLARVFRQTRAFGMGAGLLLFACIVFFGSAFLGQTLKMLFLLKRRDYAVCRAMGMSRIRLRTLLMVEILLTVGADVLLGGLLGIAVATGLSHFFFNDFLQGLTGIPFQVTIPWLFVLVLSMGLLALSLAAVTPRILSQTAKPTGYLLSERS